MPTELDYARLAAFIDGEGCIHIKERQRGKYLQHGLDVSVTNTDPRLMLWLKNTFGGNITPEGARSAKRKSSFKWRASERDAEKILSSCLGLFIMKRAQAELALAFRATYRKVQQERVSSAVAEGRSELRKRLMILNTRGCVDSGSATKVA